MSETYQDAIYRLQRKTDDIWRNIAKAMHLPVLIAKLIFDILCTFVLKYL